MPLLDKERKLIPNCTAANLFQKSERALLAFKAGKPIIKERNINSNIHLAQER